MSEPNAGRGRLRRFDQNLIDAGGRLAYRVEEPVPACWFCDRPERKKSAEHIFPQWLLDHYGARDEQVQPVRYSARGQLASARKPFPLANLVCGEICRDCNNGWMSRLEARVKPLFLGDTTRGVISTDQAATLAWWFIKTAIVLNVSQPYRLLVDATCRHEVALGNLDRFTVGLFRVTKRDGLVNWIQGLTPAFIVPSGVATAQWSRLAEMTLVSQIRIQDLVAQVVYLPPPLDRSLLSVDPSSARPLWPDRGQPVDWSTLPLAESLGQSMCTVHIDPDVAELIGMPEPMVDDVSNTRATKNGERERVKTRDIAITEAHMRVLEFYGAHIDGKRSASVPRIATVLDMDPFVVSAVVHDLTDLGLVESNCCQGEDPTLLW